MKHIIRKSFWDYENEEKWINEMSAKGMALTDYSWRRYVFEETPNNQYIYRLELLENVPTHPESIAYLKFLEENGIECVTSYMRWVYLRKKATEGSFDIYTDIDSKIRHFKRINTLWNTIICTELAGGLSNLLIGFVNLKTVETMGNFSYVNIIMGFCLILLGLLFFRIAAPIRKKLKRLMKEKTIQE